MAGRKRARKTTQIEKTFDGGGAKRVAIQSHKDIDSEDDFEATQDKILLEGERRESRATEGDMEASDEEVFALSGVDSEDEDDQLSSDADEVGGSEEEEPEEGWGDSKKEYYDNDDLSDENDLKAEEEEALRIQKRNLAKLDSSAYVDDLQEWNDEQEEAEDAVAVIEELPTISQDLSKAELIKILHTRNPEFSPFSLEFQSLIKQLDHLDALALRKHHPQHDLLAAKMKALRSYLAVLAFYFVLMSSPQTKSLNIKEHEIMVSLVRCRQAWQTIEAVKVDENQSDLAPISTESEPSLPVATLKPRKRKRSKATRTDTPRVVESFAPDEDDELEETFRALKSLPKKRKAQVLPDLADNVADSIEAEDSAARRKTLQFYASQINQKSAAKRNAATQSGDLDLPYRERKKEREARLQAEAERRKGGTGGADLDDEATGPRDDAGESDDEYYQLIAAASKQQKETRKQDHDTAVAEVRAERAGYALPDTVDGKRKIGRDIAANKGVRVNRPKENRNARVKKRNKYDAAKKKLASQKAIFKQPTGSYGGETSGINHRVIKSTRLDQGSNKKR